MAGQKTDSDNRSVLDCVIEQTRMLLDGNAPADIVTFIESGEFLGQGLYPRQRLHLKLFHKLELTTVPCWCRNHTLPPEIDECLYCHGTGVYDEFADTKYLLSCVNKYASLWFPGLCRHHITGQCDNPACHDEDALDDYVILPDDEIRRRLLGHYANTLLLVWGRRSGKSMLLGGEQGYALYTLLRDPDPHKTYDLVRRPIGVANVATDEDQATIVLEELKGQIEHSPFFRRFAMRPLKTLVEFPTRRIYARSYHSNSASVRGQTLLLVTRDEFWHFNKTAGKFSDRAMADALFPSVATFGTAARILLSSSPLNKFGVCWDYMDGAQKRSPLSNTVICSQIAAWEVNPKLARYGAVISGAYARSRDGAEVEYGRQIADSVGVYIPAESIDAAYRAEDRPKAARLRGEKGTKYCLALDLSQNHDGSGLVITHFDKAKQKVIVDLAELHDPRNPADNWRNERGEIDHESVFNRIVELWEAGFRFRSITLDQFNSEWLLQALRKRFGDIEGKWITKLTVTQKLNNEMFGNLRNLFVQGQILLYYHRALIGQLRILARTAKPSGNYKIEAPPSEHDDLADALAASALMTLVLALGISSSIVVVDKPRQARIEGLPAVDGIKHSRRCTAAECTLDCPRRRRQEELDFGVNHLPGCGRDYCDMGCPLQRRRLRS